MADQRGRGRPRRAGEPAAAPAPPTQDVGTLLVQALQVIRGQQPESFFRRNQEFIGLGGTQFHGTEGPLVADQWLNHCKMAFEKMQVTEVQK